MENSFFSFGEDVRWTVASSVSAKAPAVPTRMAPERGGSRSSSRLRLLVVGEAVDRLGVVGEDRHAGVGAKPVDEFDNEIRARADDVLRLVDHEVLDRLEILGHVLVGPDEFEHPLDVLVVGRGEFGAPESRVDDPRV